MIRNCYTCKCQYQSGRDFACELYGQTRYSCNHWTAKPGIWVPVTMDLPNQLEDVTVLEAKIQEGLCITRKRVMHLNSRGFVDPYSPDEADEEGFEPVFWMRHPAAPDVQHIREELRKL